MGACIDQLKAATLPWLLDEGTPAVRPLALRWLLDRASDDPDVAVAGAAATWTDPITSILAAQNPEGWWAKPANAYGPKFSGTIWQLIFLDQLGADGSDTAEREG